MEPVWITEFWLSDMEVKTEKTSGSSKTHGELDGENKDFSNLEETVLMDQECAES